MRSIVVVPTYNEAENIEALLAQVAAALPEAHVMVVDDASHQPAQTTRTFELLWPLVAPGGYYVIEDTWFSTAFSESVAGLTRLLDGRDGECDWVHYRWGLAIAHKRVGVR